MTKATQKNQQTTQEHIKRILEIFKSSGGLIKPHFMLSGISGCLHGDTRIKIKREGIAKSNIWTIKDMYHLFNGIPLTRKTGKARKWDLTKKVTTYSIDEKTNRFSYNDIEGIVQSGIKDTYNIKTTDGDSIQATKEHKFLTDKGFKQLKDLRKGDIVLAKYKGTPFKAPTYKTNIQLQCLNNVGFHPHARKRQVKKRIYTSHYLHRMVIEAKLNNIPLEQFLYELHNEKKAKTLQYLPTDIEIHHIDRNRHNNTINNLRSLSKAAHAKLHMTEDQDYRLNYAKTHARYQTIESISFMDSSMTYDIQMKNPFNNFVANNFVVHNSGKTYVTKAILTELDIRYIEVNSAQLTKEGYAGNSLSKVLTPLNDDPGKPTVVIMDEIDKLFLSNNSNTSNPNEITIGIQNELLKLLESDTTETFGNYGHFITTPIKRVMFIFLGAWNNEPNLTLDKLRKMGVKTELIGRMGLLYHLDPISADDMIDMIDEEPLFVKYKEVFNNVDEKHCKAEVAKYIKKYHGNNAIGARLMHHLLHDYFINRGSIDADKIDRLAFIEKSEQDFKSE
ncbi:MAG: hypothetical protein DRI24_23880 [Deltaproteobacteria bacterium]|nr:MAG: hypothetical protein DRI24_23880 [Deltaproteobacteria bacterium]